ncbi:MAG: hypothetical protein ABJC62_02755 [Frankiaceae bacterium]
MSRLLRWYGAGPLHLLALLASLSLAGYAVLQFSTTRPLAVAVWFVGAAVAHDVLLLPLYAVADRSLMAVWRRTRPGRPPVAWMNYVRVPAVLSGLLLLVWFPSIFRLSSVYRSSTGLSSAGYLARWLLVTAALFAGSALALAVRMRSRRGGGS